MRQISYIPQPTSVDPHMNQNRTQHHMSISPPDKRADQAGQRPDFCRILLIGDSGSGKTSLITRFIFNTFTPIPPPTPTPAPNRHRTQRLVSSSPCIIELVEAEPQPSRSVDGNVNEEIVKEIANADAVVLVYSICGLRWHPLHREVERERDAWRKVPLEGVRRLGGLVKRGEMGIGKEGEGGEEGEEDVILMVLGCQRDREELRIVREEDGRALAAESGCGFAEIEVESGFEDVNAVIDSLVGQVRERRKRRAEGGNKETTLLLAERCPPDARATRLWDRILRR